MHALLTMAILGMLMMTPAATWGALARAAPSAASIQAALNADEGWSAHSERDGIVVESRAIPGVAVAAYRATKRVDVDPATLFATISDIGGHPRVNEELLASEVIKQGEGWVDYYQVVDLPMPLSNRYWFSRAEFRCGLSQGARHCTQTWNRLPDDRHAELRGQISHRFNDAVEVPLNHGSWEVIPAAGGESRLVYRVVSDPGGRVTSNMTSFATGRTLPENILKFERAAKARR